MTRSAILTAMICVAVAGLPGQAQDGKKPVKWAIAVHGGTIGDPSRLPDALAARKKAALRQVLNAGKKVLSDGGTSLDAVETVVRLLENDPDFNAGRGAVFNSDGEFELDASIMDGRTKACGAVAGVRHIQNPISLSRLVMTKTRHVLLAGKGAERFAVSQGITLINPDSLWTEMRREQWLRFKKAKASRDGSQGTVGCVALDAHGNLAAATSTGGLTGKMPGRVGDSPVIAAGTYADNESCAVSCTGTGEEFIRHAVAFHVSARMLYAKESLANAVKAVLTKKLKPGDGGIISVDHHGAVSIQFTTKGMSRAAADSNGRFEVAVGR